MAKDKKGLGRGLSSLLGGSELSQNNVSHETKEEEAFENQRFNNVLEDNNTTLSSFNKSSSIDESKNIESSANPYDKDNMNRTEVSSNPEDAPVIIRESNNNSSQSGFDNTYNKNKKEVESDKNQNINSETASDFKRNASEDINSNSISNVLEVEEKVEDTNTDLNVSRETNENYIKLKVDDIEPNPDQPRRTFDEQKLQELAHSVQDQGVLQPIVVRRKGDKYQIIAGERRWQAARIAGLKEVPCVLQEANDEKALELALIENIQRDDLNPIEEAYTYKRLMDKLNYTQAELAKAVAKGRSTIANAIRLLDLPEEAQEAMFNEKLTAGHARAVLSVPNPKSRIKLTQKIIEDKLSVREAESLARLLSVNTTTGVRNNKNNIPSAYTAIAKSLKEVLGTQVRIRKTKSGSKLEISFTNEEELRNIYEKLAEE